MASDDKRLIEDYLPIQAISKEASREKSVRKGHISTLHLWWARRPLVACRAAVYGALVPADQWVKDVELKNPPADAAKAEKMKAGAKKGLNRRQAKEFVSALCKYPGDPRIIQQAQDHILAAHAKRLTAELAEGKASGKMPAWVEEFKFTGENVTMDNIVAGQAPRPRVLDMFAGGGAIPLEALRLGCEAYALDLNPVAHIIELCTLVYPQTYGKPDPKARGMTGPENDKGERTWGGLTEEARYWGNWVFKKVEAEIGDLYPLIPDLEHKGKKKANAQGALWATASKDDIPPGYLTPVAYLWTRTVKCKNPACGATVPLLKQTWLRKKKGRYVALRMIARKGEKKVSFKVAEATSEAGLGFDPSDFSSAGNATCRFCGTAVDSQYVMDEGCAGRRGSQLICIVGKRPKVPGKIYLMVADYAHLVPDEDKIRSRLDTLCARSGLSVPAEKIGKRRPSPNARGLSPVTRHGFFGFADLFTTRQLVCLLSLADAVNSLPIDPTEETGLAVKSVLALVLDRVADYCSSFCQWRNNLETVGHTFSRHALAMLWDYAEGSPLFGTSGTWRGMLDQTCNAVATVCGEFHHAAQVRRGSALTLPWANMSVDAVITDPPYYDNIPYADVSDFFYIWLQRSIGESYPEHFSSPLTPKKSEATALASRYDGDSGKADYEYERMMLDSFREANRVLKPNGTLAIVYAHKTTLGWATLVEAVRKAGFSILEAWPLSTEMRVRLIAQDTAALASSIFLVGRKRQRDAGTGAYETDVRPKLQQIVRERIESLWDMEIAGADLVIACVGAGLRAFTRYERVEFANGEVVPAERFLTEVETAVLETILAKLSKEVGANSGRYSLGGVDPATRFYILWRYTYRSAELDAGEAIIFANGTHVELEGTGGLCYGNRALLEKKTSTYHLRDYAERGKDDKLGRPGDNGEPAPLVDALHRTLWLMRSRPTELSKFLAEANVNLAQLRLVAQALAGPALSGSSLADVSPSGELGALKELTSNWRSLTEGAGMGPLYPEGKKAT